MPRQPEHPSQSTGRTGNEGGWLIRSFNIKNDAESQSLLKDAAIMAKHDGDSFSELVVRALKEYVKRHAPGNPQLILGHWTEQLPMPESTQHVHDWQLIRSGALGWAVTCRDPDCVAGWFQLGGD